MSCDNDGCECETQNNISAEPNAPEARPNVPRLTLHVDLPDLDPETIRREVIQTAISQWVLEHTHTTVKRQKWLQAQDGNGRPQGQPYLVEVAEQVKGPVAFRELIQKEVSAQITAMIQPHLREILEVEVKEILAGEIQIMDQWGTPKSSKITIRELIRTTLDAFMREKVDSSGQVNGGSYGKTRLEWAIKNSADEVFKSTFKPMVDAAVAGLKAEMASRTTDALKASVLQALGIKA